MKLKSFVFGLLLALSANAFAGAVAVPTTTTTYKSTSDTENRVYAGLVWTLQDKTSWIPDLSLGFRSLRVKSNDNAEGGDLSVRITLNNGIAFDSTRLSYVGGNRDLLGNIGVGYSHANATFLGVVGVQGPYIKLGSDFELTNKRFVPFLEVLTLDKPNNVDKKAVTVTNLLPPLIPVGNE